MGNIVHSSCELKERKTLNNVRFLKMVSGRSITKIRLILNSIKQETNWHKRKNKTSPKTVAFNKVFLESGIERMHAKRDTKTILASLLYGNIRYRHTDKVRVVWNR